MILVPGVVVAKVRALERAGFLGLVLSLWFGVGEYLTRFGYFAG